MTPEEKLQHWLGEQALDGIVLRTRSNFSWITQGKVNHIVNTTSLGVADLIVLKDKKYCLTAKMEARRIMEEELHDLGYELIEFEWYENQNGKLEQLCNDFRMAADTHIQGMKDISSELVSLRSQLSEPEIEKYTWLCQQAAQAVETMCHQIEPGMTEFEIAAVLSRNVIEEGINPHVILVATDDRIFNYRHPIPTDKKLEKYAMIVLCAEKWGLVANATRFVHFGDLPPLIQENKEKLAMIDTKLNVATRPGSLINQVFQTGLEAYAHAGYPDDWRLLHQGGLTGYATREYLATMHTDARIEVNQAFTWNPAIHGIKSEDTILVGEKENRFLTHTGNWVYIDVEYNGKKYKRPDILIR